MTGVMRLRVLGGSNQTKRHGAGEKISHGNGHQVERTRKPAIINPEQSFVGVSPPCRLECSIV